MSFYWNDRTDAPRVGSWVLTGFLILVVCWALAAGIWGLGVATAGIYGKGEAHKTQQSGNNRIFQDQHFFQLYGDIKAQTSQLQNAAKQAAAETDPAEKSRLNSVVLGIENLCQQNIQRYNADAQAYISSQFRSANLPESVPTGSTDNCKETS